MAVSKRKHDLRVDDVPEELLRGIRMVCARKGMRQRLWVQLVLYAAIDAELADYPTWRWQSKPGEELALLSNRKRKK